MKKTFVFGIVLGFLAVVIAFVFLFVPNWFHEQGHIGEAKKQGINLEYRFYGFRNLFEKVPIGESILSSVEDCERFNSLTIENKQKITHAGVLPGIVAFTALYWIIFLLLNFKLKFQKGFWLVLLFMYLLCICSSLWSDMFSSNPLNDWNRTILDCSKFG